MLQDKATFRRISLAKHPNKSSNSKYQGKFKVANNKLDMVNAAYNVLGMSDDIRDFHLYCEYYTLWGSLTADFFTDFATVHNGVLFKKIIADI